MSHLQIQNLTFRYPGTSVSIFRPLSFSVDIGEAIRIHGRNGSGKTTLLKVLAGIYRPTAGKIKIKAGGHIVYMDQNSAQSLSPELTIREHLLAFSSRYGYKDTSIQMIEGFQLGLERRLDEFTAHLSGGQRQIIALICALISSPTVLCLDEFTSAMDDQSAKTAQQLIRRYAEKEKVALIIINHQKELFEYDQIVEI